MVFSTALLEKGKETDGKSGRHHDSCPGMISASAAERDCARSKLARAFASRLSWGMSTLEWWEMASYVVTVVGLPFAIVVFMLEQRKERQADQEEIYQRLSDEYREFLKLVIDNPDLQLLRRTPGDASLTAEQHERRRAIFEILISLFERAYLLVYEEPMDPNTARLWSSWEDYMREWCNRDDFRAALPDLLQGEDPDFQKHILALSQKSPR
jgi:hypothetical protein